MILTLSFGGAKRICSLTVTSGLLLFNLNGGEHGLRTPREEIAVTAWPKIQYQSQIFSYGHKHILSATSAQSFRYLRFMPVVRGGEMEETRSFGHCHFTAFKVTLITVKIP